MEPTAAFILNWRIYSLWVGNWTLLEEKPIQHVHIDSIQPDNHTKYVTMTLHTWYNLAQDKQEKIWCTLLIFYFLSILVIYLIIIQQ